MDAVHVDERDALLTQVAGRAGRQPDHEPPGVGSVELSEVAFVHYYRVSGFRARLPIAGPRPTATAPETWGVSTPARQLRSYRRL